MGTAFREASRGSLRAGKETFRIHRLDSLAGKGLPVERLPMAMKILLENLLRHEDGRSVHAEDVEALARWDGRMKEEREIAYRPARVLLQDFTGVPVVVDLAAMRDAMAAMGGDPLRINPLQPVDLVIDHSVQVDVFGTDAAFRFNVGKEYERNRERYQFLRWGQSAFQRFRVVPPGAGIVHQVNLEYLASVVFRGETGRETDVYPDTLVGTDSHTTMVNGLGVLGWGVGGIEAEAAMLGQPIAMLVPEVVGFELRGKLPEGATGTDLVLTITQILRRKKVVGKFVEFHGEGLAHLSLPARATIANMAPEFGATCALFPVDAEVLQYLRFTGREEDQVALVEAYCKEQGLFHSADSPTPVFTDTLSLDLSTVEPSLAGPRRPQDRIPLADAKRAFRRSLIRFVHGEKEGEALEEKLAPWIESANGGNLQGLDAAALAPLQKTVPAHLGNEDVPLPHGAVVVAAITSCTNTSNPEVMIGAGLLARNAVKKGLRRKPWVKTSLAPGSKVVTDYLAEAGLDHYLDQLGFQLVGYGCTTCIGNSGPLPQEVATAIEEGKLVAAAVLSGNRNFEGRINPHVRANYLASPPLVVAYALAGRMDIDLHHEPLGQDAEGRPVRLADIWPTQQEVRECVRSAVQARMFTDRYSEIFTGDERWSSLEVREGERYPWDETSTYIKEPPFFEGMKRQPEPIGEIRGARVLALLGDSVTTDHISPAGSFPPDGPAGRYLRERGVAAADFNSFGSRRGNHEVMMRGTFANIRLRNRLLPGSEGGVTRHLPDGAEMTIYDAAMQYQKEGTPLVVLAGAEYGTGSSRDWAAKGTVLLGVRAVIARSFERIHRSNLVGMGVLPLQFREGEGVESLGLTGEETFDVLGIGPDLRPRQEVEVLATAPGGEATRFTVRVRVDTPVEMDYYRHGGILPFVLRQLIELPLH